MLATANKVGPNKPEQYRQVVQAKYSSIKQKKFCLQEFLQEYTVAENVVKKKQKQIIYNFFPKISNKNIQETRNALQEEEPHTVVKSNIKHHQGIFLNVTFTGKIHQIF